MSQQEVVNYRKWLKKRGKFFSVKGGYKHKAEWPEDLVVHFTWYLGDKSKPEPPVNWDAIAPDRRSDQGVQASTKRKQPTSGPTLTASKSRSEIKSDEQYNETRVKTYTKDADGKETGMETATRNGSISSNQVKYQEIFTTTLPGMCRGSRN
jgi:hypothetical protein